MISGTKSRCISRELLRRIPIVRSKLVTENYVGLNHGKFADVLVESFEAAGHNISNEYWYVGRQGSLLIGVICFTSPFILNETKLGENCIVATQANDGRNRPCIQFGFKVYDEFSGVITSKLTFSEKTKNEDLVRNLCEFAAVEAQERWEHTQKVTEPLLQKQMTRGGAAKFLLDEVAEFGIISEAHLYRLWRECTYSASEAFGINNALSMVLGMSSAASKNLSPFNQMIFNVGIVPMVYKYLLKESYPKFVGRLK